MYLCCLLYRVAQKLLNHEKIINSFVFEYFPFIFSEHLELRFRRHYAQIQHQGTNPDCSATFNSMGQSGNAAFLPWTFQYQRCPE